MTREEKQAHLTQIAQKVGVCRKCSLWRGTTQGVSGEGDPEAKIMFIGEGPGFNEDRLGRPFVGQAGKLLDQLLDTISVRRQDVFITNVVKHRPSDNRDPLPIEMEACGRYLDEQIEIIEPRIVVTLGRFSMNKFLPGEYISRVHGLARYVDFGGRKMVVLPMYHPAAALRNGAVMLQLQEDFKKIMTLLGEKADPGDQTGDRAEEEVSRQLSLII
ncbi:MAG: uracil-DNA glycosylase [Candidatus Shapirobacteria bacterium]